MSVHFASIWRRPGGRVALLSAAAPAWAEADAHLARAEMALVAGQAARAQRWLRAALAVDAEHVAALHGLALQWRRRGWWADASALLVAARRLAPDDHRLANDLGLLQQDRGHLRSALAQFDDALRLRPAHYPAQLNRAGVLARLQHTAAALQAYEALIADHPQAAEARVNLASVLENDGQLRRASEVVRETLVLAPREPVLNLTAARLERRAGQLQRALARLRRVQDGALAPPLAAAVHAELARVHDALDDPASAMRSLRRSKRLVARAAPAPALSVAPTQAAPRVLRRGVEATDRPSPAVPLFVLGVPGAGLGDLARRLRAQAAAVVLTGVSPLARLPWPAGVPDAEALESLREAYAEQVAARCEPSAPAAVIDICADGLWQLERLITLFPTARIAWLQRHAADAVLACYAQHHVPGELARRSLRLADVIALHAELQALIDCLAAQLGPRLLRLRYEALWRTPEAQVAALLGAVGVGARDGWHGARLVPAEGFAVGRWRRYWPWLACHRAALEALCAAQGYRLAPDDG